MHVSIIICCYNSATRIKPTLEHIAKQFLNGLSCEVILVDNNCSDNTVQLAIFIWNEYGSPFSLKIIKEENAGLSNARKTGVFAAEGEVIIFCDDDNWLDKNYVSKAYQIIHSDFNIGIVGGRSVASSNIEIPFWFCLIQNAYAVGVQGFYSGIVNERGYLWGAGIVLRRIEIANLYQSGFSNWLSGRLSDGSLLSGDDSEICKWFRLLGKNLYYSDELVFTHFIPECRLNEKYYTRLIESFKNSKQLLYKYDLAVEVINKTRYLNTLGKLKLYIYWLKRFKKNYLKVSLFYTCFPFIKFNPFYSNIFISLRKFESKKV